MVFFCLQDVKVSALALLKMVMHARSGGNIEVMGLLLGKVDANVMVVFQKAAYVFNICIPKFQCIEIFSY